MPRLSGLSRRVCVPGAILLLVAGLGGPVARASSINVSNVAVNGTFSTNLTISGSLTVSASGTYKQWVGIGSFGTHISQGFNVPNQTITINPQTFSYNNVPASGNISIRYDNHLVIPQAMNDANISLVAAPLNYNLSPQNLNVNVPILGLFNLGMNMQVNTFGSLSNYVYQSQTGINSFIGGISSVPNGNQGSLATPLPGNATGNASVAANGTVSINLPLIGNVTLINNTRILDPVGFNISGPQDFLAGTVRTVDTQPDPTPPGGTPPYPHNMQETFNLQNSNQTTSSTFPNTTYSANYSVPNGSSGVSNINITFGGTMTFSFVPSSTNLTGNITSGPGMIQNFAPSALAGGPYFMNASNFGGITLSGNGSDPDGDPIFYTWYTPAATISGQTVSVNAAQAGLTSTVGPGSLVNIALKTTDIGTPGNAGLDSPLNGAAIVYTNTPVTGAVTASINVDAVTPATDQVFFFDPDLNVNAMVPGFETHTFSWTASGSPIGNNPGSATNVITAAQAVAAGILHPNNSIGAAVTVTDKAGTNSTATFNINYTNSLPSVNPGPNLVYSATQLSNTTAAVGTDPDLAMNAIRPGFETQAYNWTTGNNPNQSNNTITIQQAIAAGMLNTITTGTATVTVTDFIGTSANGTILLTYNNTGPTGSGLTVGLPGGGSSYNITFTDPDLQINALRAGGNFEQLTYELDKTAATNVAQIGDGFVNGTSPVLFSGSNFVLSGTLTQAQLLAIFGSLQPSYTAYANVRDKAGQLFSFAFTINVVPEPTTALLWSIGAIGLVGVAQRRRPRMRRE